MQIKADGYTAGHSQLTAFILAWRGSASKAPHAFAPLAFEPGEAFQFDRSEEGLVVGGIYYKLQVSHMKLCASRAFWLVAYPSLKGKGRVVNARFAVICAHYLFDPDFCNVAPSWEKGVDRLDGLRGVGGGAFQMVDRVAAASREHRPEFALDQPPDEGGQVPHASNLVRFDFASSRSK